MSTCGLHDVLISDRKFSGMEIFEFTCILTRYGFSIFLNSPDSFSLSMVSASCLEKQKKKNALVGKSNRPKIFNPDYFNAYNILFRVNTAAKSCSIRILYAFLRSLNSASQLFRNWKRLLSFSNLADQIGFQRNERAVNEKYVYIYWARGLVRLSKGEEKKKITI